MSTEEFYTGNQLNSAQEYQSPTFSYLEPACMHVSYLASSETNAPAAMPNLKSTSSYNSNLYIPGVGPRQPVLLTMTHLSCIHMGDADILYIITTTQGSYCHWNLNNGTHNSVARLIRSSRHCGMVSGDTCAIDSCTELAKYKLP